MTMFQRSAPLAGVLITALLGASLLAGCGGTTAFRGGQPFAITGAPVPPPPVLKADDNKPTPRVEVKQDRIELNEKIQFEVNRAVILPESHSLLEEIAGVIKDNPQIRRIAIGGHASAEGSARANKALSEARARAVMKFLVEREGVSAKLLEAKGFGSTRPIAGNDTEEGREQNRRVELVVVDQDIRTTTVEADPPTEATKASATTAKRKGRQ